MPRIETYPRRTLALSLLVTAIGLLSLTDQSSASRSFKASAAISAQPPLAQQPLAPKLLGRVTPALFKEQALGWSLLSSRPVLTSLGAAAQQSGPSSEPSFVAARQFAVGGNINAMALGDFN